MANYKIGHWSFILGTAFFVSGCEMGGTGSNTSEDRPVQMGGRVSNQDVESPDLFQARENGLWDGRPSLGGVWVAYPGVTDPQRVVIRNETNGKSTVGALFRRERENPGPKIQLSSDAADKLGILAGQPTMLSVIALQRKEPEQPETPPAEGEAAEGIEGQESEDVAAAAVAAVEAVEGQPEADGATAADDATPVIEPVPEAGSSSSFGRRAPRPSATAAPAEVAVDGTAAAAGATADAATPAAPEIQPVPETRSPSSFGRRTPRQSPAETPASDVAASAASGDVTSAPLDATAGAATASAGTTPPTNQTTLREPYIQAGTFTTEANANAAVGALRAAGLGATTRPQRSGSNTLWRIVVGPANSRAERNQMLEKVKRMGYRDAFPVRG